VNPLAEVGLERQDATVIAHVEGEVDLSNVDEIRTTLVDAVVHETECLILDLSETSYLDSTGIRLLFELAERLAGRRQQMRLVVSDAALVRRVIELTQLDQRVPIDATVAQAIEASQSDA
jgi:anti-sigma B factor antagonist